MGDNEITLENFKQWTKDCGVKRVQIKYEELARDAKAKGRTLQEEMKAQGFKDFNAFSKQCERFSTACWPLEFKELGSGYVLYFQYMWFLMGICFLMLGLQAPAMALYAQNSDLGDWEWHDWQKAFSTDNSACKCVGGSGFGATCGSWDYDRCPSSTNCSVSKPGQWLCHRWCYAGELCPTTKVGDSAGLNVRMTSGTVKAYSSCQQDDKLITECKNDEFRSADISYAESDVLLQGKATFIGTQFLSPGNLGPDESQNALIPVLYLVCVAVLCGGILLAYSSQVITDHKVDLGSTSPNDFAIMVKGLPVTATDEEEIMEFFSKHAVPGKENTEIVKVVIGWDVDEFRENMRQLKTLSDQLHEREDQKDEKSMEIKQALVKITQALKSAGSKDTKLKSSGVVVVTFRYQADLRACLNRWRSFWARWFYADAGDLCGLPLCMGPELARYPIGGRPIAKLSVTRAPNPGDINWTELAVPLRERLKQFLYTNGVMALLVMVCFGAVYGLREVQEIASGKRGGLDTSENETAGSTGPWPGIGAGLVVAIVNALLMFAAKYLGEKEYHDTLTEQEFSQALKMSIGMIVNTGGVILFMYTRPAEWYMSEGLVQNVFTVLVINAIIPPLIPYIDFGYRMRYWKRRSLTQARLEEMNETKKSLKDAKSQEAKDLMREIEGFKRAFAPSRMNMLRRYAQSLKVFVCCLLYMPVLPLLSLVGLVGLAMQYWMDKYLLLHWQQRPLKPASADMANMSVRFIKFTCPLGLSVAFYGFLTPSYYDKNLVLSSFLLSLAVGAIFSFAFPLSVWVRCWLSLPCNATSFLGEREGDYYQAQYMWSKEMKYHKDQFIYKRLPDDKNPEMLQPGKVAAMKIEDAKECYGASVVAAAAEAADGAEPPIALKSGRVFGAGHSLGSAGGGTSGGSGAPPVTYGAVSVEVAGEDGGGPKDDERSDAPLMDSGAVPASVAMPVSSGPSSSAPGGSSIGRPKVVWEYEVRDGYTAFHDDCQKYMEQRYQDFVGSGGNPRCNVKTQGKKVSIDFEKMTSKVDDSHKIRKIKRRETE
eukprot:TRINITY_DN3705_c0_g1_i1.p1 TRINITY_DN3705_c0_g1~~TRINITY_DN3705_c0_g1_i1.p1  ORF type:complete len:1050 (-),score=166.78 TRINITY_DN3705_c0_g1_i1:266-3415(-)